jgi:nicotinamidase-related amidase
MADLARRSLDLGRRPALLLVDMIEAFTDPSSPLGSDSDRVVTACQQLLVSFRAHGLPVIYTTVIYDSDDQAPVFRRRLPALDMLRRGSAAVRVDRRLAPEHGDDVIEKRYASAFFDTDLDARLINRGADSLVVTGLTTSGCVRATVVDGLQNDFCVWVPREAVGDRNAKAHAANLHDMHAKYAEVVSLDATLEAIAAIGANG